MPSIKIYSTGWCAFCKAEKKFLDERGVVYEEIDVENNQEAAEEMVKVSGQMGVPVTVITHDDGSPFVLVGFDQTKLKQELNLT
jgi:NADH-dependent peroxiredoxin subunit F